MQPWERRLNDLAHILESCDASYFDPETFRRNTNHFLQTSRTVTFIIQKNKDTIPNFDAWYLAHGQQPWGADKVMLWARESRNQIEKEGDLEVHSSLGLRLIFSYFDEEDIPVPCGPGQLLMNMKRLLRFARRSLPTGVSDVAVVRFERQWIANSLPDWELLHALTYIYARTYELCTQLALHLGFKLPDSIAHPSNFDPMATDGRRTRYLKLNTQSLSSVVVERTQRDPDFKPSERLQSYLSERDGVPRPVTLAENVEHYARVAQITFEQFGYHMPMLFMFDGTMKTIDFLTTDFEDQASKFVFWRSVADRVAYLKPQSLIWICEAWTRSLDRFPSVPTRNMKIIGETLNVVGIDSDGGYAARRWEVRRDSDGARPKLEAYVEDESEKFREENYWAPITKAFAKLKAPPK